MLKTMPERGGQSLQSPVTRPRIDTTSPAILQTDYFTFSAPQAGSDSPTNISQLIAPQQPREQAVVIVGSDSPVI
jgi:hypothetical protein